MSYVENTRKSLTAKITKFDAAVRRVKHDNFCLDRWENLSTPELVGRHDDFLVWGWKQTMTLPSGYQVEVVVYLNTLDCQGAKAEIYIDGEFMDNSTSDFTRSTILCCIDEWCEENYPADEPEDC